MADLKHREAPRAALTMVPPSVCPDTIAALEELLTLARAGEAVGLAFCAILRGRDLNYIVDLAGEARRHLVLARGMVCSLDDELKRLILDRDRPGKDFH